MDDVQWFHNAKYEREALCAIHYLWSPVTQANTGEGEQTQIKQTSLMSTAHWQNTQQTCKKKQRVGKVDSLKNFKEQNFLKFTYIHNKLHYSPLAGEVSPILDTVDTQLSRSN